ncbi:kinetochore component CENP-S-domain-containing protein [Obelidium mucronatum]|nr:kinetochore component CENP-S-domain-containing protein [Obelidium mucronatum]
MFNNDLDDLEPPESEESLRLQASLHYSVNKIINQVLAENKVQATVTPQYIHAVASIVWHQCNGMATDLEAFAKHGKRSVISADDVKLCVRKNPDMVDHLNDFAASLKEGTKKRR